jgi:hypothetical protein
MYCSYQGRPRAAQWLAYLLGALFIGLTVQSCKSAEAVADWFKGDFAIGIEGAPDSATNLYLILGKSEVLNAAAETDDGFRDLVLNGGIQSHIESFEFNREQGSDNWVAGTSHLTDTEEVLTVRKHTRNKSLMLFRVARNDFKGDTANAIAVVVRFNNDADWQGVAVDMNEFKDKEEALITIGVDGLKRSLFEDYRDKR